MILGSDESKTIPLDYDIGRLFRQYDHAVFVFFSPKKLPISMYNICYIHVSLLKI